VSYNATTFYDRDRRCRACSPPRATSPNAKGGVAEKIRAILDKPYVMKVKPEGKAETTVEHHCSSSIGVALFLDHEVGAEQVIKWADIAMYQAKEAGGNQVRFFDA
jgi:GGDEF domain-containing protein